MPNINPANWNYDTAAHLLLRAGFGHNGQYSKSTGEARQVRHLANKTPDDAVDSLLTFSVSKAQGPAELSTDFGKWDNLYLWWFNRMVTTGKPLREKMVLFLHTHFATARAKVDESLYMAMQNALFREFATGDFRELVKRIDIDPAMLWWLDNGTNAAGKANENYARELQELFTLGVYDFNGSRNYSQVDVTQVARILTGWQTSEAGGKVSSFFINPSTGSFSRHDKGAKTVYAPSPTDTPGQNPANQFTEPANTTDAALAMDEHRRLIDQIFNHVDTAGRPTVARNIARKAWKFFAYDPAVDASSSQVDRQLIDDLADAFKGTAPDEYSLKNLMRAVLLREEFYEDATRTVKNPLEFVVGTRRMLRAKLTGTAKTDLVTDINFAGSGGLVDMGQEMFNPPDVFSWRGNQNWISTQTLLARYDFASTVANSDKGHANQLGFNVYSYLDKTETTRQAIVDRFLKLIGPLTVDAATNTQLLTWLGASDPIDLTDDSYVQTFVRGLVNLILTLPHYHVH